MSLRQKTLPFRERKSSKSLQAESQGKKNESKILDTEGFMSPPHTPSKPSTISEEGMCSPLTSPSKRRNKSQSDPHSPPKIKCADKLIKSPNSTSTTSKHIAPSPKTPSTILSKLTLESPAGCRKNDRLPPKSLFPEPVDLLSRARNALHTHSVTELPGREDELAKLRNFINKHLDNGTSGSLYISGPPGSGKTACLSHVMEDPDIREKCKVVNINCTAVGSPHIVYSKVIEQLKLKKSDKPPLEKLTSYLEFRNRKPVLMVFDEMDQLGMRNQSVLYTVFEWPATYTKNLILIGIANALDLTDRMLPRLKAKVKLAPELLHFAPYSRQQLLAIYHCRLKENGAAEVFMPSALQLLASKQAAVHGDARRALDTARRLVEKEGVCPSQGDLKSSLLTSESDIQPVLNSDDSPSKNLRSSPRKPMTPVSAPPQASDKSNYSPSIIRSLDKSFQSPTNESNVTRKENSSPVKSKSARKLNFQVDRSTNFKEDTVKLEPPSNCKPIGVTSVMTMYSDVYGTSHTLGRSVEKQGEELPFQHKLALCSLLLILGKSKNKDVTLGKHHDVYRKVCTKRKLEPLDQGSFFSMLELIESRGIIHLQNRGKSGAGRLIRVCLQWVEGEVISALQDKELLASVLCDVACLS